MYAMYLQVMNLIGDVKGKVAVMVDDMIDTAGELRTKYIAIWFIHFPMDTMFTRSSKLPFYCSSYVFKMAVYC